MEGTLAELPRHPIMPRRLVRTEGAHRCPRRRPLLRDVAEHWLSRTGTRHDAPVTSRT